MKLRKLINYKYKLEEDIAFSTGVLGFEISTKYIELKNHGVLVIRKGYMWDGVTGLPRFATDAILKHTARGSLLHDAFYQLIRLRLLPAYLKHKIDLEMKKQFEFDGLNKTVASMFYQAVKNFGSQYCKAGDVKYPKIMEI